MMEETFKKCTICNNKLPENANFCPICGEPISNYAKFLVIQKDKNSKLEILGNLIKVIDNPKSLQIIRSIIQKLTQK